MNGLLGNSLPPGLAGYVAQRQMAGQENTQNMAQLQGLLGAQNAMFEQQLNPLKLEQLKVQLADAKRKSELVNGLLGGAAGGGSTPVQMVNGKPMEGGMSAPGQAPRQGGLLGAVNDPQMVMALKLAGIGDFTEMYKYFNTPQERKSGSFYVDPITQKREFIPKVGEGMSFGEGGTVTDAPGYLPTLGKIEGAKEGAKASFDVIELPDGRGGKISLPRNIAIQMLQGNLQNAPQQAPAPSMAPTPLAPQGRQVNPNDPLLASGLNPQQVSSMRSMDAAGLPFNTTVPGLQPRGSQPVPTSRIVGPIGSSQPESVSAGNKVAAEAKAKAESEVEVNRPLATNAYQTSVSNLDRLSAVASSLVTHSGLDGITGLRGAAPDIPGSDASNARAQLDTLKSQVAFGVLQAMRDASKTGGALGAVSERELALLESNLAALSTKQSKESFQRSLRQIVDYANEAKGRISQAYKSTYGANKIANDAEFNALPSGSEFIGPDGVTRRKP